MDVLRSAIALPMLLAFAALAPPANAAIELKMTDGATTVSLLDGDAGDICPAANCVTFAGAIGGFVVNVTTGTSKFVDALDLNSLDVATAGAGTLTVQLSDDGYHPLTTGFMLGIGGTITGGTLTAAAYGGNSNTKFDTSNQLGSTLVFNSTPFAASTFGLASVPDPYALTILTTLSFRQAGQASYDASLNPVPEPSSIALIGSILLLTGGAIRRKLRKA